MSSSPAVSIEGLDVTTVGTTIARLRGALKAFAYSGPARDRWQYPDRVLETVGVNAGQRVADIGAGGGYFTYRLARAVGPEGRVYALDPDGDMRARVRERADRKGYTNILVPEPDDDHPALPEPVDLVLVVNTFHHLPDERTAYFRVLTERLREGGRVAVIEPRPRWFLFGHATAAEDIRVVVTEAGFTLAEEHDFLPRQSFTIFSV